LGIENFVDFPHFFGFAIGKIGFLKEKNNPMIQQLVDHVLAVIKE
jgi:hypothetical protein